MPIFSRLLLRPDYQAVLKRVDAALAVQRAQVVDMLCGPQRLSPTWQPAPETCAGGRPARWMTRRSKVAARLIQKLPEVVQPLRDGRLCPTGIVALAKELTVENPLAILLRFFHLSRREAAEVSAAIRLVEQPPLRDVVTAPPVTSKSPRCDMNVAFHVKTIPPGPRPGSRHPRPRRKSFRSPRTFVVFT